MATQPLSLEDGCLLHLISHLEKYPLEALASLPLHLRRRLLLSLPAVDICQLEDTAVTQGIDMDNRIWREVVDQLSTSCTSCSFKKSFFDGILWYFFRGNISIAGDCLFAVHGPLRDHFSSIVSTYPLGMPSRHTLKRFNEELFVLQLLSALVNDCRCLPECVSFQCDHLARTDLWKRRNVVSQNLLCNLLCETKSLSFNGDTNDSECLNVPRNVLELIFSRPTTMLTSLSLSGHSDFVLRAVADTELFFAPPCSMEDQNVLQSLYPQLLQCPIPYSELTSLNIGGCEELQPEGDLLLHEKLNSIVLYQSALESITFSCVLTCPNSFEFYATLGRLFYQPQFNTLKVEYVDLDWKHLSVLIPPFLVSPISPDHEQQLYFRGNGFILDGPPPFDVTDAAVNSSSVLPGKALGFTDIFYHGDNSPKPFLHWLSQLGVPGRLSSFEFSIDNWNSESPEFLGTAMSLLQNDSSSAMLRTFSISDASLLVDPSPEVPFNCLFTAQHLEKVSISHCEINKDKLLPVITQALLKQVPLGALKDLCLDCNDLGDSCDEEFQDFADAVFNLPQLTKLKLSLKYNELKTCHFTILYGAWRSSSRAQMCTLDVDGNDYKDLSSLLRQIAINGDFINSD